MNVCAHPECGAAVRRRFCHTHFFELPFTIQKGFNRLERRPDPYEEQLLMQKARCCWAGVPQGAIDHGQLYPDLDDVIAVTLERCAMAVAVGVPPDLVGITVNPRANHGHVPWGEVVDHVNVVVCRRCRTEWPCDDAGPVARRIPKGFVVGGVYTTQ